MQQAPETFFNFADFVPELREEFTDGPPDPKKLLRAAIPIKNPHQHPVPLPAGTDRHALSLTDGEHFWFWEPESLASLFRGAMQPRVLGDYPEAYNDSFIIFDVHVLEISNVFGD